MTRRPRSAVGDLFAPPAGGSEALGPGAVILRGFAAADAERILAAVNDVAAKAPFRNMVTPGGYTMSVAMTNAGVGWVTDRKGYRYDRTDPDTGKPWPPIPPTLAALAARAAEAAEFPGFAPDGCLINRYEPGTKLSLHQDRNERDFSQPIVSVSLGLPATFLWGGERRAARPRRIGLASGDVVVWGGPSRLAFHGVDKLADGEHPLTGRYRFNLTLRKAL